MFGAACYGGEVTSSLSVFKDTKGGREGSGADRRSGGKGRNDGKGTEAERSAA